jgi:hypothetical protein
MSSLQQNWRIGQSKFCWKSGMWCIRRGKRQQGKMAQTMYAHMNKLINNKKTK